MKNKQWMRAGVGAGGVMTIVLGASLALAPAADAATPLVPTPSSSSGLTGGVTTTVGGIVNGVVTPNPGATSPVTVTTTGSTLKVGVNSTTTTVGTASGLSAGVAGSGGTGAGVVGSSAAGTTVGGSTSTGVDGKNGSAGGTGSNGADGADGVDGSTVSTGTSTSSSTTGAGSAGSTTTGTTGSAQSVVLTAISASAQYGTVYPAKDGYRDTVEFTLKGVTSDGQQHRASGVATLTFGSSTVATWPITSTDQVITWNGLKGGRIVPGRYLFSARIGDGTNSVESGTDPVDVSAKKLAAATTTLTSKAVSGTHRMAALPLAGLSKGKVTVKVLSRISGVKGKQYLVFSHGAKKVKVLIRNGKHTSKAVVIPKSFTTYKISHTWKSGVKITSLRYRYSYKALK